VEAAAVIKFAPVCEHCTAPDKEKPAEWVIYSDGHAVRLPGAAFDLVRDEFLCDACYTAALERQAGCND
jgi:hypothetical protein